MEESISVTQGWKGYGFTFCVNDLRSMSERTFLDRFAYNRTKVYIHQDFLKIVVHMIIIDQCNQTARLFEIEVTVSIVSLFLSL